MKIAAGCFGCLAFIFFVLIWITAPLIGAISTLNSDVYNAVAPLLAYITYANWGCCCLSAVLAVVFLAVGMMGRKDPIE